MNKNILWVVIALVVATIAAFGGMKVYQSQELAKEQARIESLANDSRGSDFNTLVQKSKQQANNAKSLREYNAARAIQAYGQFMTGSFDQRLEAVRIAREQYMDPNPVYVKADAMNQLTEFVTVSAQKEVYDEVFRKPPFNKYYKEGDTVGTIAGLAQESYGYRPTVVAAAYSMLPPAAALTNFDKVYTLTATERKAYAEQLKKDLHMVKDAYDAETALAARSGKMVDPVTTYTYYYWDAYYNGVIARVDASYVEAAKTGFDKMIAFGRSSIGENGKPLPILLIRLPKNMVSYINMLLKVGGTANTQKAKDVIAELMKIVDDNPDIHKTGFILHMQTLASGTTTVQAPGLSTLARYAKVYPPFKEFAKKYGLVLK